MEGTCSEHEKVEFQIQNLYTSLDHLTARVTHLERTLNDSTVDMTKIESETKAMREILERIEKGISDNFTRQDKIIEAVVKRVEILENAPKVFWSAVVGSIAAAVISGISVWLFTRGG